METSSKMQPLVIGSGIDGKDIVLDFAEMPSLLIASENVYDNIALLKQIYRRINENECFNNYIIIDIHGEMEKTIGFRRNVRHILEHKEAVEFLKKYADELERNGGCNESTLLLIDDLPSIMLYGKKNAEQSLSTILTKCFNSKLRLILLSHHNKDDVVTPLLCIKLNYKIVFGLSNPKDSERLLGNKSASEIDTKGECVVSFRGNETRGFIRIPDIAPL